MLRCTIVARYLRATSRLHKRSGKPTETPDYKQVYLPYEVAPTKAELDRERRRFSQCPFGKENQRRAIDVKDVPANMYTFGKEGMSIPIGIFKDQPDPVIGAECTYPGIYENKIACKQMFAYELFEMEANNAYESPLQRHVLNNQINKRIRRNTSRYALLNLRETVPMTKDRGASTGGKKVTGGATPATPTTPAAKNPDAAKKK